MDFLLFASSSLARRRASGPHLPGRVGLACLPRGGRATGSRLSDRRAARQAHPAGPTEGGAAAGAAGRGGSAPRPGRECGGGSGPGRIRIPGGSGGRGEGGARRGFHPRMRIRTFAFSSPPLFLKAKAVIYRPFRFAECSLFELDIQTPPKGAGGAGVEKRRPRRGRPCAAAGPGAPPRAPGTQNARPSFDSKAQICPPPPTHTPPSFRGLILRPPRPPPPLKG